MAGDILFLAHRIPFPPDRGDKIRSWHLLRHLAGLARVHLACFADDEEDAAHLVAIRERLGPRLGQAHVEVRTRSRLASGMHALAGGVPVSLAAFESATMAAAVGRILSDETIDAVFVFSGQMAQYVPSDGARRFVMDFGDVDSEKFAAYASGGGLLAPLHRREARLLSAVEQEIARHADLCLFVSDAEAALFASRAAEGTPIEALQNGVDLEYFDPAAGFKRLDNAPGSGPLILFTGQMDYAPNVEAVTWFAREVMPLLPGACFVIAGRKPRAEVSRLAGASNVMVTGAVPDMRAWLAAADVVVAPLRIARGIQNKVLEAMAMARPVVASPCAFEGIDADPGVNLVVAESAADQASAIRRLIADPRAARKMGLAARSRVEASYGWEARLAPLAGFVGLGDPRPAAHKAASCLPTDKAA